MFQWISRQRARRQVRKELRFRPRLLISDFDGVLTSNKVLISQDGEESVICDRSDSWGLTLLKRNGIQVIVLTTEGNPVVTARCRKLGIPCYAESTDKLKTLKTISDVYKTPLSEMIYIGNDTNDLTCLQNVGLGVAVADSHPDILPYAQVVLSARGGDGALRELCDLILNC